MAIKFHTTIIRAVRAAEFRVSDEELGKLIRTKSGSDAVSETLGDDYFRVLIRRSKDARRELPDAEAAVKAAHRGMLKVAGDVLVTKDIEANPEDSSAEKARKTALRQKATGFARSAGSVLAKFIKVGGDLDSLDPAVHGKNAVVEMTKELEAESATPKTAEERVRDRLNGLLKSLRDVHGEDSAKGEALRKECQTAITNVFTG